MNGRSVRSRSLPCLSKHLQGGGKQKKRQKRKSRGDKDSFTLSAWDYFTSPSPSSPFSPLQKQIHKEKGRGNYSSMLLHKKPVALLPVVFLLRPEQTLFSCPSPGEITTGKCFPSYTLSWLGIIYIKLLWKLLPSPSSAGYLQATGDSLGEVGSRRNPLWICSTHETSWGGLSPLQRGTCPCREATPRTAGSGERGHPRLVPPAVNPGISPARPFIFMTFSYGQHLFLTFFFFPPRPAHRCPQPPRLPGHRGAPRQEQHAAPQQPTPQQSSCLAPDPSSKGDESISGRHGHRDCSLHPRSQPRTAPKANSTPLCLRHAAPRTHRWHYI